MQKTDTKIARKIKKNKSIRVNLKRRNMKTKIYVVLIIVAAIFSSCDQIMDQMAVTTDSGSYTTELSIAPASQGDHLYVQKLVEADLKEMLAEHGFTGAIVKKINVTSAIVSIAPNSTVRNFNSINVLNAIIEMDSLPADTIATYTNTIANATSLTLDPLSVDVADYLGAEEYSLAIDGTLKEPLTDTLKVNFKVVYEIVLGL